MGKSDSNNSTMLRGGRDSMSSGDMADMLPMGSKLNRVKKTKAAVEARAKVPAGASAGALGNAPLKKVTSGLKTIFRARGSSQSGNAAGEINTRG